MKCLHCKGLCIKKGKTDNGIQKYQCGACRKYQREEYARPSWRASADTQIATYVKEGCGIRSIARIMKISSTTVLHRIRKIASCISKPIVRKNKIYEMDELKTYVQKKSNEQWLIYAIQRSTRSVVDFRIGRRNKKNLKTVADTLILSQAKEIYTDHLNIYPGIIPSGVHKPRAHKTNYIERKNLTLRTHLKRLARKTICFSRSVSMLTACMTIYFWG